MARPVKNFCDYFPHDRDMRNHKKVKAIRTQFGITGYAIWVMLLETLTGSDGNVLEYSDLEFELLSGDYGISGAEIRRVLDYCILLEMLFIKDGFIHSESLNERLAPVYEKRRVNVRKSSKQLRVHGKFSNNNTVAGDVSVTEMPQSKVNKSKVNNIITNSDELGGEENQGIIGVIESKEKKKKVAPKKKRKNPDAEPYWKEIRAKWVWFNKTHLRFNVEPIPDRDYSHMHRIIEKLRERTVTQEVEWTNKNALDMWEKFLIVSYTKDDWLNKNYLLGNLESKMQKIFNLIDNPNGQTKSTASSTGREIELDRP